MAQALFQNFLGRCLQKRWQKPLRLLVGALVFALPFLPASLQNAIANGDTRTLTLHHAHTGEDIAITFKQDGVYDEAALKKLNWFLRDWRINEATTMDPRLFDIVWEVYRASESKEPIQIVSAYRSPQTNAMLRARSKAVAKHSQHMLGKAMDVHFIDVPMSRIREIAMRMQEGGVGFYPNNFTPFVHIDAGSVRHWPRMSHTELARLFPDGKTVHIPSDGVPLARYEEAKLEIEQRGGQVAPAQVASSGKSFFAALFGGGEDDEDVGGTIAPQASNATGQGKFAHVASLDMPVPSGQNFAAQNEDSRSFFLKSSNASINAPPLTKGVEPKPLSAPAPKLAQLDLTAAKQNLPQGATFVSAPAAVPSPTPSPLPEPPVPSVLPLPPQRAVVLASVTQDPISALLAHNNAYASNQPFAHQTGLYTDLQTAQEPAQTSALAYAPLTKGKLHDLDTTPVGSLAPLTPEKLISAALNQKPLQQSNDTNRSFVVMPQKSAKIFRGNLAQVPLYAARLNVDNLAALFNAEPLANQSLPLRFAVPTRPQAAQEAKTLTFDIQSHSIASGFQTRTQFWGSLVTSEHFSEQAANNAIDRAISPLFMVQN